MRVLQENSTTISFPPSSYYLYNTFHEQVVVEDEEEDILPPTRVPPEIVPLQIEDNDIIIVYDLETTTARCQKPEIMQIGASTTDKKYTFDQYILPVGPVGYFGEKVTGLSKNKEGKLVNKKGEVLPTVDLKEGVSRFLSFLQKVKENEKGNVVLVAHNGNAFDNKHLIRAFIQTDSLKQAVVAGFSDSLLLMKDKYPERKGKGKPGHKVGGLYEFLVGEKFEAHNAAEDVRAVCEIIIAAKVKPSDFSPYSSSLQSATEKVKFNEETSDNRETLEPLVELDILKKGMANKFAEAGLNYDALLSVCCEGGPGELTTLIRERVTRTSRIINRVVEYYEKISEGANQRIYWIASYE